MSCISSLQFLLFPEYMPFEPLGDSWLKCKHGNSTLRLIRASVRRSFLGQCLMLMRLVPEIMVAEQGSCAKDIESGLES